MHQLINCNLWKPPKEFTEENKIDEDEQKKKTKLTQGKRVTRCNTNSSKNDKDDHEDNENVEEENSQAEDTTETNSRIDIVWRKQNLPIPQFRVLSTPTSETNDAMVDYNEEITAAFLRKYEQGLIVTYPPDPPSPAVSSTTGMTTSSSTTTAGSVSKMRRKKRADRETVSSSRSLKTRLWKFFHPTRWSLEEVELFHELHAVWGEDWNTISDLMCNSKSVTILKMTYAKTGGQIDSTHIDIKPLELTICQVCQKPRSGKKMIFCECCDRGYHLKCVNPPLDRIPTEPWFCSEQCASVLQTVHTQPSFLLLSSFALLFHIYFQLFTHFHTTLGM
jgi:hypothetical protein